MNAVLAADLVVIRRTVPVMCVEAVQVASRRPWQGVGTGTSLLQAAGRWACAATAVVPRLQARPAAQSTWLGHRHVLRRGRNEKPSARSERLTLCVYSFEYLPFGHISAFTTENHLARTCGRLVSGVSLNPDV